MLLLYSACKDGKKEDLTGALREISRAQRKGKHAFQEEGGDDKSRAESGVNNDAFGGDFTRE